MSEKMAQKSVCGSKEELFWMAFAIWNFFMVGLFLFFGVKHSDISLVILAFIKCILFSIAISFWRNTCGKTN